MCPLCALTGLTTWMLVGGAGSSCAATAAVYWRRRKLASSTRCKAKDLAQTNIIRPK
jgi:hypothetical protein